jgi:hypothetical protein
MGHIILRPSEGRHTEDFPKTKKIQQLRPGLNPRTQVPVASMLTTRPPKPAHKHVTAAVLINQSALLSHLALLY